MAWRTLSPSLRSVPRSSPNTLTAMLARVPDSMWSIRCEIGCPIVTLVPGSVENSRRNAASSSSRGRPVSRRPTSISAASTPCTCSSYSARPGAARRGHHLGLRHQDLLDAPADLVGLGERRAGQRVGLHRQAALVELRQERGARAGQRADRARDRRRRPPAATRRGRSSAQRQRPCEPRLQRAATSHPSCPSLPRTARRGRNSAHSAGVTRMATASDASSATI